MKRLAVHRWLLATLFGVGYLFISLNMGPITFGSFVNKLLGALLFFLIGMFAGPILRLFGVPVPSLGGRMLPEGVKLWTREHDDFASVQLLVAPVKFIPALIVAILTSGKFWSQETKANVRFGNRFALALIIFALCWFLPWLEYRYPLEC